MVTFGARHHQHPCENETEVIFAQHLKVWLFVSSHIRKTAVKRTPSKPPPGSMTPALRRFLFFTAAITGGAIMVIEILGARMLAPYFGTSHFVWIAQIAITLAALSAGYYAGGFWVDRAPRLDGYYLLLMVAAGWLALTIPIIEPVCYYGLRHSLARGSLLASALLFFVPLSILATTGPFLLRSLTHSTAVVGGNAGRLTAIGTLGSFAGTGLIGYVLIPLMPNTVSLLATAGIMALPSLLYFLVWNRASRQLPVVLVGIGLLLGIAGWGWHRERRGYYPGMRELYRGNSHYGQLQVLEGEGGRRYYLNDFLVQNTYDPDRHQSASLFTFMLHDLARAYCVEVEHVLCIGMGVGIVPMQFAREGAEVEVVEINPSVPALAARFFECEPDKLKLTIDDGRHYLNRTEHRFDAVVLDAFLGDSSPSHLMTREALSAVRRVLKPDGVLVINSFGDLPPEPDFFRDSLTVTLRSVFRSVRLHASGNGNLFFVASARKPLEIVARPDPEAVHPACRYQYRAAFETLHDLSAADGIVLSDDFNPVEYFDAEARERTRRQLAIGMRRAI
jgi:spermidine synthase